MGRNQSALNFVQKVALNKTHAGKILICVDWKVRRIPTFQLKFRVKKASYFRVFTVRLTINIYQKSKVKPSEVKTKPEEFPEICNSQFLYFNSHRFNVFSAVKKNF